MDKTSLNKWYSVVPSPNLKLSFWEGHTVDKVQVHYVHVYLPYMCDYFIGQMWAYVHVFSCFHCLRASTYSLCLRLWGTDNFVSTHHQCLLCLNPRTADENAHTGWVRGHKQNVKCMKVNSFIWVFTLPLSYHWVAKCSAIACIWELFCEFCILPPLSVFCSLFWVAGGGCGLDGRPMGPPLKRHRPMPPSHLLSLTPNLSVRLRAVLMSEFRCCNVRLILL